MAVGGTSPLLKQIGYKPCTITPVSSGASPEMLTLERPDGSRLEVIVEGLQNIAEAFNQELERKGDLRRFVSLDTDADWFAFYLFDKATYKTLCKAKSPALPLDCVPGIDEKKW